MERFRDVLLDVWREACRHIEIRESTATVAAMLAKGLPLAGLIVRRLDEQHQALETIAVGQPGGDAVETTLRTALTPAKYKRLLAWAGGDITKVNVDPRKRAELYARYGAALPDSSGSSGSISCMSLPSGPRLAATSAAARSPMASLACGAATNLAKAA